MREISPQNVYDSLNLLENYDITTSAFYRELAQEILADTKISLMWRQMIAERLNNANLRLAFNSVGANDSY